MLSFHSQLKIFVATAPCNLRAGFNGLWNAAQTCQRVVKTGQRGDGMLWAPSELVHCLHLRLPPHTVQLPPQLAGFDLPITGRF